LHSHREFSTRFKQPPVDDIGLMNERHREISEISTEPTTTVFRQSFEDRVVEEGRVEMLVLEDHELWRRWALESEFKSVEARQPPGRPVPYELKLEGAACLERERQRRRRTK